MAKYTNVGHTVAWVYEVGCVPDVNSHAWVQQTRMAQVQAIYRQHNSWCGGEGSLTGRMGR